MDAVPGLQERGESERVTPEKPRGRLGVPHGGRPDAEVPLESGHVVATAVHDDLRRREADEFHCGVEDVSRDGQRVDDVVPVLHRDLDQRHDGVETVLSVLFDVQGDGSAFEVWELTLGERLERVGGLDEFVRSVGRRHRGADSVARSALLIADRRLVPRVHRPAAPMLLFDVA